LADRLAAGTRVERLAAGALADRLDFSVIVVLIVTQ